jgi:hypothetical protein
VSIVALQIWGSYRLIANAFKWLALALPAYIGAALIPHAYKRQEHSLCVAHDPGASRSVRRLEWRRTVP